MNQYNVINIQSDTSVRIASRCYVYAVFNTIVDISYSIWYSISD